ncbi:MAG: alkaline phosphatase, partial [Deferrisomatales bacterium]
MPALLRPPARAALAALLVWAAGCAGSGVGPAAAPPARPAATARHLILFVGDGMQLAHEVAASRYLTGRDRGLAWHAFPYQAPVATWDVTAYDRQAVLDGAAPYAAHAFDPRVGYDPARGGAERYPLAAGDDAYLLRPGTATDSAAAATALATGVKTDRGNLAWRAGDPADGALTTLAEAVRSRRGGAVGVVTTVPFSHATPAAFVSHNVSREHTYTGRAGYPGLGIADEIVGVTRPEVVIGGGHPAWHPGYATPALRDALAADPEYLFVERRSGADGGRRLR